jgi:hypothetical protein
MFIVVAVVFLQVTKVAKSRVMGTGVASATKYAMP